MVAIVMVVMMVVWILSARGAGRKPPSEYTGCADHYEGTKVEKQGVEI